MVEALPGVFRLFSEEPMLSVQAKGFSRFILSGSVPEHRDPGLRLECSRGDATAPLAERSTPWDAFRALEKNLPRGVHARATDSADGLDVRLTETIVPAARLPAVQVFSTDLKQRVKRLDDNRFELCGPTGAACLITLKVDARRTIVPVPKGFGAAATASLIAERVPAGYHAEVDGAVLSVWKNADLHTLAA